MSREKTAGRIIILREIYDARDILFGPFDLIRSFKIKVQAWTNILEKAKSLGIVKPWTNYKYMRDVYWKSIKKTALKKRNNNATTGKLTKNPIDELVYAIVDDLPSALQQPTLTNKVVLKSKQNILDTTEEDFVGPEVAIKSETDNFEDTGFKLASSSNDNSSAKNSLEDTRSQETHNKKRKMEVEIEYLELQNYKRKPPGLAHSVVLKPKQNILNTTEEDFVRPEVAIKSETDNFEDTGFGLATSSNDYSNAVEEMTSEEIHNKERKMDVEIEYLELQNYKTKLPGLAHSVALKPKQNILNTTEEDFVGPEVAIKSETDNLKDTGFGLASSSNDYSTTENAVQETTSVEIYNKIKNIEAEIECLEQQNYNTKLPTLTHSVVLKPQQNIFDVTEKDFVGPEIIIKNETDNLEDTGFGLASFSNDYSTTEDAVGNTTFQEIHNKKRKMELEIEYLELQNYKTKLEIFELEQKLGVKHSKFTKEIVKRKNKQVFKFENFGDESDTIIGS